jgi:hypothetical protein
MISSVSITAIMLLLKSSPPFGADLNRCSPRNILRQAARLDFVGTILVAGAVTCLVLALQWGGNTMARNGKSVITVNNVSTLSLPQKFDAKLRLVVRFCGSHQHRSRDLREILGGQRCYGPAYDL